MRIRGDDETVARIRPAGPCAQLRLGDVAGPMVREHARPAVLAGHAQGLLIIARQDQLGELGRAGHVCPLTNIDEIRFGPDGQNFEPA